MAPSPGSNNPRAPLGSRPGVTTDVGAGSAPGVFEEDGSLSLDDAHGKMEASRKNTLGTRYAQTILIDQLRYPTEASLEQSSSR